MKKLFQLGPVRLGLDLFKTYSRCGLAQAAAALSYFLILTLFPLLMCVNYLIGLFHLNLEQVLGSLHQFLPQAVLDVLLEYLRYASQAQSPAVLLAAMSAIVLSASAGMRTLFHAMDRLYGRTPQLGFGRFAMSILLSVLFLLTIYLSVVVIFTGDWFFRLLELHLPREIVRHLPLDVLSGLWRWLRYLLLFCFVLLLVLIVYWVGTPSRYRGKLLHFSALITALAMACASVLFSWFIGMSSRYSLLYGSLASLIILLVWLYLCGNILLLGAAVGRAIVRRSTEW